MLGRELSLGVEKRGFDRFFGENRFVFDRLDKEIG
jgi:hypothetical protein